MKRFEKYIASVVAVLGLSASLVQADYIRERAPTASSTQVVAAFSKADFVRKLQQVLQLGNVADALKLYDDVPADYASDLDLCLLKASLLISSNKLAEAKAICEKLNKQEPGNEDVVEMLAYIARLQGNAAEQTKQLKTLLEKDQYNVRANIGMADSAFDKKNYNLARQYYQRALVREPENEDALFGLGQSDYFLGSRNPSMDKEAEASFKKILEKNPAHAPAYAYLAKLASANSKYKIASDYVQKAISYDGENYNYVLDYGMYECKMGHFDIAEREWTKAISMQPTYFLAYAYRGGLYDEQDMISKALDDYMRVIKYNPDYYYAYESIGVLALHEKQWARARAAFQKCSEFDKGKNISYPLMITYCYYMEGNKIEAKKYSDKVLRKMDRSTIEYAMLRMWHDQAGEMPLPQKIAALDNGNKKGKMYFYLGLYYDMFGGKEFAMENYAKVLGLNSPMIFEYRLAEWSLKPESGVSKN